MCSISRHIKTRSVLVVVVVVVVVFGLPNDLFLLSFEDENAPDVSGEYSAGALALRLLLLRTVLVCCTLINAR
jgi:hypothetical protein